MGSKKTVVQKENSTQTAAPPSWSMPGISGLAERISAMVPQLGTALPAYQGDFVAQPGATQTAIPQMYLDSANLARSLVPQAQGALDASRAGPQFALPDLSAGTGSFAGTNPGGMDGAVTAAIQPYIRQLTEQILPSLQSAGIESGAYGGSRGQQTLPSLAIRDSGRQAMEVAAGLRMQDFENTAGRNLQAYGLDTARGLGEADVLTQRLAQQPELLDMIMRMSGGAAELQAAGSQYDMANRQAEIDNNLQRYNYESLRPFQGYDVATDLLTRLSSGYGTTTRSGTSTTTEKTGGLGNVVAGAMGLASMAGSFAMPGGGSLGGSLVSSLFGKKKAG